MNAKVSSIVPITYEEMLYVATMVEIAIDSATDKAKLGHRYTILKSAHTKMWKALEEADKAGLIDINKIRV